MEMYGSQVNSWKLCHSLTIGKYICYAAFWYEAGNMAEEGVIVTCVV